MTIILNINLIRMNTRRNDECTLDPFISTFIEKIDPRVEIIIPDGSECVYTGYPI